MVPRHAFFAFVVPLSLSACSVASEGEEGRFEEDLITSCTGDWRVAGRTPTPVYYDAGSASRSSGKEPSFVDLDGDGHLDMVVPVETTLDATGGPTRTGPWRSDIYVQRGDGKGGFAPSELASALVLAKKVKQFRFADFDGNGRPDILAEFGDGTWQVVLLQADGSWLPAQIIDPAICSMKHPGTYVTSLRVGDVNGDGKADLELQVVGADATGASHAYVTVEGTAQGLGAPQCQVLPERDDAFGNGWFELRHALHGDFDGDGKADVVGYGRLRSFQYVLDFAGAQKSGGLNDSNHNNMAYGAVVGRFDADDVDDTADLTDYGVSFYYGDRDAPFTRTAKFDGLPSNVASYNNGHSTSGDFNGDGRTDFFFVSQVVTPENGRRLAPTVCSTSGGKHRRYETRIPSDAATLRLLAVVDIDKDGRDEVILREGKKWAIGQPITDDQSTILVLRK